MSKAAMRRGLTLGRRVRAVGIGLVLVAALATGCTSTPTGAGAPTPPRTAEPAGTGANAPNTADATSNAAASVSSDATADGATSLGSGASHPAAAPPAHVTSGTALALLTTLRVKGRAPMTGYSRSMFGTAWTDDTDDPGGHNGCRTRDDILSRDLTHVATSNGCKVTSGILVDPYTGKIIHFTYGVATSNAVQIDHVVALGDAWQTGAQQWSTTKRTDLANDPLNLLAVDGPANESKGDGDAATWLPPNKTYRCAYVARQVAVKARYGLWVTHAEHDAIAHVLTRCPGQKAPVEGGHPPTVAPTPATSSSHPKLKPSTRRPKPTPTTAGPTVIAFANCTEMHRTYPHGVGLPGAHDHTSGAPDTQFFVSKVLYEANAKSDRDKDGIACEA